MFQQQNLAKTHWQRFKVLLTASQTQTKMQESCQVAMNSSEAKTLIWKTQQRKCNPPSQPKNNYSANPSLKQAVHLTPRSLPTWRRYCPYRRSSGPWRTCRKEKRNPPSAKIHCRAATMGAPSPRKVMQRQQQKTSHGRPTREKHLWPVQKPRALVCN